MRNMIGTDYFRTLGTSLLAGRDFSESDMIAGAAKVAIVNEQFTRRFALGADAVRRHFRIETNPLEPEVSYEIVGVVSNTKYHDLREQDQPIAYVPLSPAARRRSSGQFLVRAAASGDGTTAAIRSALDAGRVRYSLRLYDDVVRNTLVRERLMAAVAIPFGILAGLLSAIGLYAVFSDAMARRRQEIGIRIALGATRRDIIGAFLRETALVVLIGVVPGAALAFAASRAASSLLFGVTGHDAATLFAAAGSLALVAVVATYLPARRAARVDPIAALRAE
jgi:hypothetical protein